MYILTHIYLILHLFSIFFLVLPFFLILFSLLKKEKRLKISGKKFDFACIITAYKNAEISVPLIDSLLKQKHQEYKVYLVADDCNLSTLKLPDNVCVLKPEQPLGSKVKSIIHAIENFSRAHDAVVIFDPDNLVKPDFLQKINNYLDAGFKAVQGRRTAKNLDTLYACADATGEIYKNYVERNAPFLLGSSPTIAGSGMAVETQLFKEYLQDERITQSLNKNQVIVAEDKILQNFLVGKGYQIAFAKDALIYDEKIVAAHQVERQRSRWLYSYFENFPNALGFIFQGIGNLNFNQFLFGLTTISPPLMVLLLSSVVFAITDIFISISVLIAMLLSITIFTANIFLVLALSKAPKEIWKSLYGIPLFIYRQALALIKMKRSQKDFMPTQHRRKVFLEEVLDRK